MPLWGNVRLSSIYFGTYKVYTVLHKWSERNVAENGPNTYFKSSVGVDCAFSGHAITWFLPGQFTPVTRCNQWCASPTTRPWHCISVIMQRTARKALASAELALWHVYIGSPSSCCHRGTWSENRRGCPMGHWNSDPKRSRQKWNLGQKDQILEGLVPQKIVLVLVDDKKYPQKIVFNLQKVKKGDQKGGTYIYIGIT